MQIKTTDTQVVFSHLYNEAQLEWAIEQATSNNREYRVKDNGTVVEIDKVQTPKSQ